MSKHKITATRSGSHPTMGDWEADYTITFEYRAGSPETPPSYSHGGLPADPAEVEAIDIKPEFGSLDSREKAEALDWAQSWLDDEGYDEALAEVADDQERAREYAAELRSESNPSRRQA